MRNMAGREDKEKSLVYREPGSLLLCLYRRTLSRTLLTWLFTECGFDAYFMLFLGTASPVRLSFNPFLVYNPFIFKMWKMQRSVSATALLLFYHFSKISKLLLSVLAFSVRDQHVPPFQCYLMPKICFPDPPLPEVSTVHCSSLGPAQPHVQHCLGHTALSGISYFTLQREKWCPGALLIKLQDWKMSKAKGISECSFLPVILVLLNSTCMFLTLEHNVSRVWESQRSICLSLCLQLFRLVWLF